MQCNQFYVFVVLFWTQDIIFCIKVMLLWSQKPMLDKIRLDTGQSRPNSNKVIRISKSKFLVEFQIILSRIRNSSELNFPALAGPDFVLL